MVSMRSFGTIRDAVAIMVNDLEPEILTGAQAAHELELIAATKRLLAAAEVDLARRVDQTKAWRDSAATNASDWFAQVSGSTKGDARRLFDTAHKIEDQPDLREAARRGELSERQMSAVADAGAADPDSIGDLVAHARGRSLRELQEECDRRKAAADRDAEARRARIHAARSLRHWQAADGAFKLLWSTTPEAGAELLARLKPFREAEFAKARRAGRRERSEAYDADAMSAMAGAASARRRGTGAIGGDESKSGLAPADTATTKRVGLPAKVIARVDWSAIRRGHLHAGELCEIAGIGPVAPSVIRDLIESGDSLLAGVITDGIAVQRVVHAGRKLTAAQRTAMEWRDPQCIVLGCDRRLRLEIDHRQDYAITQHTMLDELEWHCEPHHDLKSYEGWQLEPGTGKRRLLAPDHSDYPGDPRGSPPKRRRSRAPTGS